jgi:hypothetical protein
MYQPDIDELKRVLTATQPYHVVQPFYRVNGFSGSAQTAPLRRSADELLKAFYKKAGLDVETLDRTRKQIQRDEQNALAQQMSEASRQSPWNAKTLRDALEDKRKAYELLNSSRTIPTFVPTRIVLDKPFLIWQTPSGGGHKIDFDSGIESMHSFVNFKIDTNVGGNLTEFGFYFFWRNDNDFPAVVNVDTSLILNGICSAKAASGILSGDACYLQIFTKLSLLEWWDQTSGQPAQPLPESSQMKYAVQFDCSGGGIGSPADYKYEIFFHAPFDLSYTLFTVPGKSVAVFYVALNVSYNFYKGGRDLDDEILVNFSNLSGNSIICPSVIVDVLTPSVQM